MTWKLLCILLRNLFYETFWGKLFDATLLFVKVVIFYFHAFFIFISKYGPVCMTYSIIQRSIYGLYIKLAPFFGDLNFFQRQSHKVAKNNSRFYILKLFISLHDSQFSCPITSLLNISLQSWCILFKIRKMAVFCRISAYFRLVSIERGRWQDKYFITWHSYDSFIHP